ncbi:nucleobindin-2-like [Ptychodera flava]|uniref:nucleobindin-2-like n=1 Tax=Ptychodera flava TaxID=63121 RepID=UPI00396A4198
MAQLKLLLLLLAVVPLVFSAPVDPKKSEEANEGEKDEADDGVDDDKIDTGLEYDRYLKEVINVLEEDPDFRKKLEEADIKDIKSGKIASEINFVGHKVRSKLDELKRQEVNRLRMVAREQMERQNGVRRFDKGIMMNEMLGHVDVTNTRTFEEADLAKLIQKATRDLDAMDKNRKEDFKKYEMEKEMARREKLKEMSEAKREAAKREWEESKTKRKEHPKVNHPGSKKQLEEVWEETDHLEKENFNSKTFFMLHDKNGDFQLDPLELEALFVNELDKIYGPDSDPREKMEEMSRMREHVMKEVDKDGDFMISLKEFMRATEDEAFDTDESWDDLGDQELFTEEDLAEFKRELEEMDAKKMRNAVKKQQAAAKLAEMEAAKQQDISKQQVQQQQAHQLALEKAQQKSAQQQAEQLSAQQQAQQQQAQLQHQQQQLAQQQQQQQQQLQQQQQQQLAQQQQAKQQEAAQQAAMQQAQQQAQREQMKMQFDAAHQAMQQQQMQQQQQQQQPQQQQLQQQQKPEEANIVQMDQGQLQAQAALPGQDQPQP